MSMLTIIQDAQRRLGLAIASAVAGSSDDTTSQMLGLLNQAGEEMADVYPWTTLQREATFTAVAAEDQGAMETLAPGFSYIVNNTIWNRSLQQPITGALSQQDWQLLKSSSVTGPFQQFRIRAGKLLMIPAPEAGQSCAFEYLTRLWATDSTGATGKSAFTVDSDVPLLDAQLLTLSLVWRFKQAQGLDFAPELQMFENRMYNAMARDGGKAILSLGGGDQSAMPGIMVSQGSWPL